MKLGRSIGIVFSAIIFIVVAAAIYVFTSLDSIVAGAIEKYGSQVTRTPVSVSSLNIDLKGGAAGMQQLSVGNPDGFTAPNIFTLGGISTRLDVGSIGKDPIVIEEILIDKPDVFYEINKTGESNIKALQKNIEQSTGGGGKAAADSPSESSGPKIVIRKLVIEGGKVDAIVAALGDKAHTAKLPRIQLNNIGEKSGGATGAEIARQVTNAIIAEVGPAVATLGLDKYIGKSLDEAKSLINEKVGEQVGGTIEEKAKQGAESLKNLFGE
jgi:hypothetical protein